MDGFTACFGRQTRPAPSPNQFSSENDQTITPIASPLVPRGSIKV